MKPKYTVTLRPAPAPIAEPVTKFGGQPVWVAAPEWPLSRETGEPMRFICQAAIDPELFGGEPGRVAYLFMTDGEEYVDGTWEPGGGENAVIIQPDGDNVETSSLATGPSLYRMEEREGEELLQPVPCEYAVDLKADTDPEPGSEDDDEGAAYEEVKIGGTPVFIQGEEYPAGDGWRLLLQIDSASVPFYVNFGDTGTGYAFLSADGRSGKFLWQCS